MTAIDALLASLAAGVLLIFVADLRASARRGPIPSHPGVIAPGVLVWVWPPECFTHAHHTEEPKDLWRVEDAS